MPVNDILDGRRGGGMSTIIEQRSRMRAPLQWISMDDAPYIDFPRDHVDRGPFG